MSTLRIPVTGVTVEGEVSLPRPVHGVVLFAHGSGSSRHSPRNRYVARELNQAGLATVLVDLLTPDEERADAATGRFRFAIDLLAARLTALTDWLVDYEPLAGLNLGLFGASTGAAAAMRAAAARPEAVRAVVSRGGRPDLAAPHLPAVRSPTMLIVGEFDDVVLELNRTVLTQLGSAASLTIVSGATHLFEEPGTLEQVARLAADWFTRYLTAAGAPQR